MAIKFGKVTIYPVFMLLVAAALYFDPGWIMPGIVISVVVHELGHIIVLNIIGVPIEAIEFSISGIAIKTDYRLMSYFQEFVASISGPVASYVLAAALSFAARKTGYEYINIIAGISMIYGIFNLLPIRPLDGGSALNACLNIIFSLEISEKIITIIEIVAIDSIFIFALWFSFYIQFNPTLILMVFLLAFYCCKQKRNSVKF